MLEVGKAPVQRRWPGRLYSFSGEAYGQGTEAPTTLRNIKAVQHTIGCQAKIKRLQDKT